MNEKTALTRFHGLLNDVAAILHSAVQAELRDQPWRRAYRDERVDDNDERKGKFRVELADGTVRGIQCPNDAHPLLFEMYEVRAEAFSEKWYGMLITVYPDMRCEVKFDYDPKCADDDTFWDS